MDLHLAERFHGSRQGGPSFGITSEAVYGNTSEAVARRRGALIKIGACLLADRQRVAARPAAPASGQVRRPARLPEPDASSHVDRREGSTLANFISVVSVPIRWVNWAVAPANAELELSLFEDQES
jgi:hypothetical protein